MDKKNVALTFSVISLQVFFYSSSMLFFELFCWDKSFSVEEISILLSVYHGLGLISYYPFGIIIDTYGRKLFLILGLLAEGAGFLLFSYSEHFWGVFGSICILSVGLSSFTASFRPYFVDIIPQETRGKMIGLSDTLQLIAKTAAPTVGGFLFKIGSFIPFLLSGVGNTLLGIGSVFLKENRERSEKEEKMEKNIMLLFKAGREYYLILIFTFFASFSFVGLGYIRLYLVDVNQFDSVIIGTFFSFITGSFAIFSILAGNILDKTKRGALYMLIGSCCRGVFLISIFFIRSPLQLYLLVLIGIPFIFSSIWIRKELYRVIPFECRGRLLSFHMIISDLSSTVAPLVYGVLWNVNPRLIALSGGSVILGGIILAIGYWVIERGK